MKEKESRMRVLGEDWEEENKEGRKERTSGGR